MSLSAGRNLVPLAYNCESGIARRGNRSESKPSSPTPEDEQITAQANEAKALLIISPRRRREQEIDELLAEHRAEALVKADEVEDMRTAEADKIVTLDAARTETDDFTESQNNGGMDIDIPTSKAKWHDAPREEGELKVRDEMREMTNDTVRNPEHEGKVVESIEGHHENEEGESREQIDEPVTDEVKKPVEDEIEEAVEEDVPTEHSIAYIPALLSKVFDENGYLHCC